MKVVKGRWQPILDLSAPWMPTTYRPHRCGFPLKGGGFCQMREGHYAKNEKDHGKPDYWRNEKRCPNRHRHTPGVNFEYTSMDTGHHVFKATGERCTKTHYQVACPKCELYLIWLPRDGKTNGNS